MEIPAVIGPGHVCHVNDPIKSAYSKRQRLPPHLNLNTEP